MQAAMPSSAQTVSDAFRRLRADFEEGSRQHPGLNHFWVLAVGFVSDKMLECVARKFGKPIIEVTKWPDPTTGRVEYSCLLGNADQCHRFRELARDARAAFVKFLESAGQVVEPTAYEPHIAWVGDLYSMATVTQVPLLRIRQLLLGEWAATRGPVTLAPMADDEQNKARLERMRDKFGEPVAVHRFQSLEHDVFTASVGMLDVILHDAKETASFQHALTAALELPDRVESTGAVLPVEGRSGGESDSLHAPHGRLVAAPRPPWVNQAELIGPCGHGDFAKLMGISDKQLYRVIDKGMVWKERGPTSKKFYFHHPDPAVHRKLREDFERGRSKRP
jgi:hypothetical protein